MRLDDGSTVDAGLVVVGIGVEPATGWLENTGLDTANGVLCDTALLAVGGDGAIAAAGDLARWPYPRFADEPLRVEHWASAVESARHAARALVHGADAAGAYEPDLYFWSQQHGVHLQSVGHAAPRRRGGRACTARRTSASSPPWSAAGARDRRRGVRRSVRVHEPLPPPVLEEWALEGLG